MPNFYGTSSNDTLTGTVEADHIDGDFGDDLISGLAGDDTLLGGAGSDIILGGPGNDLIDGGQGQDTASYADATAGVTVDLSLSTAQETGGAGNDTLSNIESLIGSE